MFTFANVPENLRSFLIPRLAAWIERRDFPQFGIETRRYGLVSFTRIPWPLGSTDASVVLHDGPDDPDTIVMPTGEVDAAALQAYSEIYQPGSGEF